MSRIDLTLANNHSSFIEFSEWIDDHNFHAGTTRNRWVRLSFLAYRAKGDEDWNMAKVSSISAKLSILGSVLI